MCVSVCACECVCASVSVCASVCACVSVRENSQSNYENTRIKV